MKAQIRPHEELNVEMVEWIDGERISLDEYDARITAQINAQAGNYLLRMNNEFNWIFGLS